MEANIESCKFHAIGRGRKSLLLSVVPGASPAFRKHGPRVGRAASGRVGMAKTTASVRTRSSSMTNDEFCESSWECKMSLVRVRGGKKTFPYS